MTMIPSKKKGVLSQRCHWRDNCAGRRLGFEGLRIGGLLLAEEGGGAF